jgi:PAS domain S-box-containing protein
MQDMKILVVDDKDLNRNELISGLIDHDFGKKNVIGVKTGEEAVEKVKARPDFFDVAVVDHVLKNGGGKMDGIDTTKRISAYSRKIFPIIFTNIPSDNPETIAYHRARAYEAGAYRYMYRSGSKEDVSIVTDFIFEIKQLSQLKERVRKYYDAQHDVPSLLTQLDIMVALIDRGYKVWYLNPANQKFQKIFDLPRKPCSMAFRGYKTMCPCTGCIVAQTLQDGMNHERVYLRPVEGYGGRLKWIYAWTQPMPDEKGEPILLDDGKPIAVLESCQDLTNSVRLKTMPMKERLSIIARALNEREDGFDRVRIYQADAREETLYLMANAGYPKKIESAVIEISDFPSVKKSIRHFRMTDEGLFHEKINNVDPIFPEEKMEKFIQWPLMKGERLKGLISVSESGNGRPCTEDGIDILRDYAEEALKAFELKEEEPKAHELENKFFALDNLLIQKRTPEDTLQTLVDEAFRLTRSDNVYIHYRDEKKARLLPIGKGSYIDHAPLEIPFSNRSRIIPSVRAIVTGQEEIKNNAKNDPDVRKFMEILPEESRKALKDMGSYCIEPLIFQNRCIGSMTLYKNNINHFDEEKIEIAREIGERMGLALHDYLVNLDRMRKDYALESSINAIAFADLNDELNYINASFLKMWGYDDENEILGKPIVKLWKDEEKTSNILERLHNGESWTGELAALKKDGSTFDAHLAANPVKDATGKPIGTMASFIDITERKRLEKVRESIYQISEKASSAQNLDDLYQIIYDIVKDLIPVDNFFIALHDERNGSIRFPFFIDKHGEPPPSMMPKKTMTEYVIRSGKPKLASAKDYEELQRKGEIDRFEKPTVYWLSVPLKTTDNKTIGVLTVQVYEKGQKYTEEDKDMLEFVSTQIAMAIQRKREEERKAAMLQEIHHRVKNNFNFISSLLDLQSRQIKDQSVKEQFKLAQDRIILMAMVHDKLYQSEDFSEINFARYIKDLTDSLHQLHGKEDHKILLTRKIENVSIEIDKAIPCGMIINELFTNSLKYAFPPARVEPDSRKNEIVIEFYPLDKSTMVLTVKDNGVGLPGHLDFFETPSMGIRLVRLLSKQMNGTIKLDQTNGTAVEVTFKV